MNNWRLVCPIIVSGLLVLPVVAWAQVSDTAGIAGVVRDTSGAVLPGVTVEAASPALIDKVRTVMTDSQGLYRIVDLRPGLYTKLLKNFHSSALKLDRLSALWAQAVLRLFPSPLRVNGRLVLVGDGIKIPKRGRKMPAVKLLHQQSQSNTKPEYIMGHSLQAVGLLVHAAQSVFSVPLAARIHEGLVIVTDAPCSTKCSACSISWPSRLLITLSPMPITPPARW